MQQKVNYYYQVDGKPYTGNFKDLDSAASWKEKHGDWLEKQFKRKLELVTTIKKLKK